MKATNVAVRLWRSFTLTALAIVVTAPVAADTYVVSVKNAPKGANDIHLVFTGTGGGIVNRVGVSPKFQNFAGSPANGVDSTFPQLKKNGIYKVKFDAPAGVAFDSGNWTKDGAFHGAVGAGDVTVATLTVQNSHCLWDTGQNKTVFFNGAESNLGFSSGNIGVGLEQRWWAAPFTVFDQPATINEVHANWFTPVGFECQDVKYKIWQRTGFGAPGALVTEGTLGPWGPGIDDPRVPGLEDWLHIYPGHNIVLPPGDYYFTIYGDGIGPGNTTGLSNVAWFCGAANDSIAYNQPQAWRSAQWPAPGFQPYAPANVTPNAFHGDPNERWNVSFAFYGTGGRPVRNAQGNIVWGDWAGLPGALDFVFRFPLVDASNNVVAFRYPVVVEAEGYAMGFHRPGSNQQPLSMSLQYRQWLNSVATIDGLLEDDLGVDLIMVNGDSDVDNEVGIGDFAILSIAYNSFPGELNWDPTADYNGDDSVDIVDYAILSSNYGDIGD
ncbi:MAG: hypothetical protein K1X67_17855 [Fimbriimonadaceae bacterium]|nr:hypothetical protein [Fimbriimonadaceae bacterium]